MSEARRRRAETRSEGLRVLVKRGNRVASLNVTEDLLLVAPSLSSSGLTQSRFRYCCAGTRNRRGGVYLYWRFPRSMDFARSKASLSHLCVSFYFRGDFSAPHWMKELDPDDAELGTCKRSPKLFCAWRSRRLGELSIRWFEETFLRSRILKFRKSYTDSSF